MATNETLKWNQKRAESLTHEEFIKEVLKLRSRPEPQKPWWLRLLETSGGAALITVLIGGLLGQIISMSIQKSLKERERELAAYTKFLDQGSETIKHAYALIGSCISAADNLISITGDEFNEDTTPELRKQKLEILSKFSEVNTKWREEQHGLGLLMRYYHHNAAGVTDAWKNVQDSNVQYMECAADLIYEHNHGGKTNQTVVACKQKKDALIKSLDVLATSVETYWKEIQTSKSP